jgi:Nucleotidyltransferase
MPTDDPILEAKRDLATLILALEPVAQELVLGGGWAAYLYRFLEPFAGADAPVLLTTDIDWAVPFELSTEISVVGLLERHGFRRVQSRGESPPVTFYQHERFGTGDPHPVHAEFLAPLRGSEVDREGRERTTVAPQPGLSAMLLRYMDLALFQPERLDASRAGLDVPEGSFVRVPHPGKYLVHKALTAPRRAHPDKRDKDIAYIYETCRIARGDWSWVRDRIAFLEQTSHELGKWVATARAQLTGWFSDAHATGPIAVSRVLRAVNPSAAPSEDAVFRAMRQALSRLGLLE